MSLPKFKRNSESGEIEKMSESTQKQFQIRVARPGHKGAESKIYGPSQAEIKKFYEDYEKFLATGVLVKENGNVIKFGADFLKDSAIEVFDPEQEDAEQDWG